MFSVKFFQRLGDSVLNMLEEIGAFTIFSLQTIRWIFARPFDFKELLNQMYEVGYKSIPVGAVSSFFIGMVMALQLGVSIEKVIQGTSTIMGGGIAIAMVRELAPVITAVLLAGRVGSAMAAEVGTMKVTEQIDALSTLATNPIHYLSTPRFLATFLSLPLVTVFAIIAGVCGGALISNITLDITFNKYFETAEIWVNPEDMISGVGKTFFFGAEIALVSCFTGFRAKGGAEGVGKATIQAVVVSYTLIIISDYFITYIFQLFGL